MKKKEILVCTLIVVLLMAVGIVLYQMENRVLLDKEQADNRLKLDVVSEVIRYAEEIRESSLGSYENHLQQRVRFMAAVLSADTTGDGYDGREVYSDGAVVRLLDGSVIWPEGIPEGFPDLNEEDLREGSLIRAEIPSGTGEDPEAVKRMVFYCAKITDSCYYAGWMEPDRIVDDQYAFLRDEAFREVMEESVSDAMILISSADSGLSLIYGSEHYADAGSTADLGFTSKILEERRKYVDVKGERSLCTYADVSGSTVALVYVQPLRVIRSRSIIHVSIIVVSSLIILVSLTHYIFAVRGYVKKNRLSRALLNRYHPKNFRRVIFMAGLTGAVVIFALTAVFQTMDALHTRSVVGAKSMGRLFGYLQGLVTDRMASDREQEEEWNVSMGQQLASLITRHPEEGNKENLQKYCDILGIDFIMLFDANGKETTSNADYSGFTMDNGLGENSSDFRRLLKGIPSVVHDVSTDPMTGLTRQMIGVTMPQDSGKTRHGALVMAIVPKQTDPEAAEISRQLRFLNRGGVMCLFTDKETGKIMYSSDDSLNGLTVFEIGMPEKSLEDGFTDFVSIRGRNYYVTMFPQETVSFYYIFSSASLFSNTLPAAFSALLTYVLAFFFGYLFSMKGYDQAFGMYAKAAGEMEAGVISEDEAADGRYTARRNRQLLISSERYESRWAEKRPETQASFILKLDILILVLLPAILLLSGSNSSLSAGSLLQFILYGDWMRGFNMFSACSVIIVIAIGSLAMILCNALFSMIAGFCERGGETICRLLYSLSRYVVVLTIMYYIFDYIGLSLSTYFASLGVVSLSISLGSREMVSDIVAGFMILFEHQFQVGDRVDLDGKSGVVLELGIRSTKLLTDDNNIRFINNSGIQSVVNMSRCPSTYRAEFTIVTGESLERVEERFSSALTEIGKKNQQIIGGLRLAGIAHVSGGGEPDRRKKVVIRISCNCRVQNYEAVRDFVNREVYLFCEQEKIEVS